MLRIGDKVTIQTDDAFEKKKQNFRYQIVLKIVVPQKLKTHTFR